jgi:hypothetical protein
MVDISLYSVRLEIFIIVMITLKIIGIQLKAI